MMIKQAIYQVGMTSLNVFAHNKGTSKYIDQDLRTVRKKRQTHNYRQWFQHPFLKN